MYEINDVFPDGMMTEIAAGTSLLICGPPMIGKEELAIGLLRAGHEDGDGMVLITTSNSAARLIDDLERHIPGLDRNRIGILDCSGSDEQRAIRDIATERVSSPGDLTGISIGAAKLLQRLSKQDVMSIRHGLVSVTTLLQYLDTPIVFKFLHIYTARIRSTNALGIFTLDSMAHDQQTMNTIMGEFDGVIELRETDTGEREVRIRGLPGTSSEWHTI